MNILVISSNDIFEKLMYCLFLNRNTTTIFQASILEKFALWIKARGLREIKMLACRVDNKS